MKFGAIIKYKQEDTGDVIKMGEIEIAESILGFIKYYKSIYCVLSEDNVIRYYKNRNCYYLNQQNIMGLIHLSKECKIQKSKDKEFNQ